MSESGPDLLRELADELESQQGVFTEAITLLRRLTAGCPHWHLEPTDAAHEFWKAMRDAQRLLSAFDGEENRTV